MTEESIGLPSEPWRWAWRKGFAPLLKESGLLKLLIALRSDDPRLMQGATTKPPPLMCVADWPVEGACAVGFACWQAENNGGTVHDVEKEFAEACFFADERLGEPAACRYFLNWFDDNPRQEVFDALAEEVERELHRRYEEEPELVTAA